MQSNAVHEALYQYFLKYMVPGSLDSEFVVEGYMDLNTI